MDSKTPITDANTRIIHKAMLGGQEVEEFVVDVEVARNLELENVRMREALEFYANTDNWYPVSTGIGEYPGEAMDYGKRACEALGVK